jgi:hypothetical protein
MQLCQKCRLNKPTIHFVSKVGEKEKVNVQLCEDCARPLMMRQEAARQGAQECEFCRGTAFSPLPGIRNMIYACCGCRSRYSQILFGICAEERPDLLERSERDISFFDMSFDPEVEDWADAAGKKAMQMLSQSRA